MLAAKAFGVFAVGGVVTVIAVCVTLLMLGGHILLKPVKDRVFPPRYAAGRG